MERATRTHARIFPRAGAQVHHHQPLVHNVSRVLERLAISRAVGDGAPFKPDKDLGIGIALLVRELGNTSAAGYRNKGLMLGAKIDSSAAAAAETCKRAHYARPGQKSFNERSYKRVGLVYARMRMGFS